MSHKNVSARGFHVLLTGATGFVGKVVLAELMRRKDELGVAGVTLLVRDKKAKDGTIVNPKQRFVESVAPAQLFADLPAGWTDLVDVAAGDLEKDDCGLSFASLASIRARTTHVIHCAASVEFDLPIKDAARANITSALGVLELARSCPKLVGMVDTSTAYVTPWREGPIEEKLSHLPRPAEDLYAAMQNGSRPEADLLKETGHPNTYTYTKCVAEHLLSQRRGNVPLAIVRPSIVSTTWKEPFPGWIDSPAALAGCLLYAALGVVPAFNGHPSTRLDVVPVDVVSQIIVDRAFSGTFSTAQGDVPIQYAAMGIRDAFRVDAMAASLQRFFKSRPGAQKLTDMFVGTAAHGHTRHDIFRRALPNEAAKLFLKLTGQDRDLKRLRRMDDTVQYLNKAFYYFTHNTFDFRVSTPVALPTYSPDAYMEVVCRGLYRHILKKDERGVSLAGAGHDDPRDDFSWAMEKPDGNWSIRALGVGMRKVLRRCTDSVTWDRLSFERAVEAAAPGSIFILAPSHRSYFDFLLTSYVCFQHPELGIPVPHIAAADDFARIPLVGKILQESRAFYIPRGVGGEVKQVNDQIRRLVDLGGSLMFFVEGARSRSRLFLPPKRGLLRSLQATGRTFTVLPIAMSYDRVPEEGALEKELAGGDKPAMSLGAVLEWLADLARNKVQLGRVHIACGEPLTFDASTDVRELSERIVAEQQKETTPTRFHLRTFLAGAGLTDISEEWLKNAIEARGGRVLDSSLPAPDITTPVFEQSLRNQWMHWFFGDALALYPNDAVVTHHVERHGWMPVKPATSVSDPRVQRVVDALFAPVRADYELTARVLRSSEKVEGVSPKSIVRAHPAAHMPVVEDAFMLLTSSGVLRKQSDGSSTWGDSAHQLHGLLQSWSTTRASA